MAIRGDAAIRAYKRSLADRFGYNIGLGRAADQRLRTKWANEKNFDALIALARFTSNERPEDFRADWGLAVAYEQAGRWSDAAATWERCIAKAKAHQTPEVLARILPMLDARLTAARKQGRE